MDGDINIDVASGSLHQLYEFIREMNDTKSIRLEKIHSLCTCCDNLTIVIKRVETLQKQLKHIGEMENSIKVSQRDDKK